MPDSAVLDTNVWLDWLVFEDPGIARLRVAVADGRIRLIATAWMREELRSVLIRPIITTRLIDAPQRLARFDDLISLVEPAPRGRLICTDPADQAFIDLACHQRARWLITKDRALLRLARGARAHSQVMVLTPAGFTADFSPVPPGPPVPPDSSTP